MCTVNYDMMLSCDSGHIVKLTKCKIQQMPDAEKYEKLWLLSERGRGEMCNGFSFTGKCRQTAKRHIRKKV